MNFSDINLNNITDGFKSFKNKAPFDHCIIDDFFKQDIAEKLSNEIPSFDSDFLHEYNNSIEAKKTSNDWNKFPELTYSAFQFLNSELFVNYLKGVTGIEPLYSDNGLNGGGWHILSKGGKLNPHLDYSLHPKLKLERKLNIIIYLEKEWQEEWGGHLGLYSETEADSPKKLEIEIEPKFNRAIFFDTTQNSWHGLSRVVDCPKGFSRKSMAVYYLTQPSKHTDTRGRALFSPTEEQAGNQDVIGLIHRRSSVTMSKDTYK